MRRRIRPASLFLKVWLSPSILAALTMFGLFSALLGQHGIWHWLSWLTLSVPLLVILLCAVRAMRVPMIDGARCHRRSLLQRRKRRRKPPVSDEKDAVMRCRTV
jgi:hypothetical protein